jgi:hypothetical protein
MQILTGLRYRYASLNNIHYEAFWTDSSVHHAHRTLVDASACAMPHGVGWYVVAVENGATRELSAHDKIVDAFRFGAKR